MPITAEMVAERRNWIGSSDVGAILGLSQHKNPYDVWLEKTADLLPSKTGDAAEAGNRFEEEVLDDAEVRDADPDGKEFATGMRNWATEKLGEIRRDVHLKAKNLPFPLATNLDGQVVKTGRPVEGKTAGLLGPLSAEWDKSRRDGIPDRYIAQCQVHVLITETDLCHVPAFLGGVGFRLFEVPLNQDFIDVMLERCDAFWKCVTSRTPPANCLPTLETIKRIRKQPEKTISIASGIVAEWMAAKEVASAAEKKKKLAEAAVLAALGDAEAGNCTIGTVTHLLTERSGYTVPSTSYRTLRFKKQR